MDKVGRLRSGEWAGRVRKSVFWVTGIGSVRGEREKKRGREGEGGVKCGSESVGGGKREKKEMGSWVGG